jgi:D-alanine--poly(phosphoribitol) ligase subunit 1
VAECTDVTASHRLLAEPTSADDIPPVGRPVYNTTIHILDPDLRPVSCGEVGEVCVTGRSVGAGYVNADGTDRFTTLSFDEGTIPMYRTGDRGYVTDDDTLVIVGRNDAQVKVRGMRMDLGDIERALRDLESVVDAVVLALPSADDRELVACLIPREDPLDARDVKRQLLRVLPRNMVPTRIVGYESFPLSPNGKVDRNMMGERLAADAVAR